MNQANGWKQIGSRLSACRQNKNMTQEELACKGILLPVLRIRDEPDLGTQEFMILAYRNVLYSECVKTVDENTLDYMIQKLCECVQEKYFEILNPDIVKELVENLKIRYPALVEGVIPDRISYSLLTDVMKEVLVQGSSIAYLPKAIERIDSALRDNPKSTVAELAAHIKREVAREDNYSNVMAQRK